MGSPRHGAESSFTDSFAGSFTSLFTYSFTVFIRASYPQAGSFKDPQLDVAEIESMVRTLREQGADNLDVEAKASQTALPKSVNETLSAFANTAGGTLLLGVAETKGCRARALTVPRPRPQKIRARTTKNDDPYDTLVIWVWGSSSASGCTPCGL